MLLLEDYLPVVKYNPGLATNLAVTLGSTLSVAGAATFAGAVTFAGGITGNVIEVTFHGQAATAMVDQTFLVANSAYQVTGVRFVSAVAESTAATLLAQVTKDTGTDAPGAGTDLLTNNTNTGFNCKATANTVQVGTLTATAASLVLAAGDRLSVDFTASATELVGVTITVTLLKL